MRTLLLTLTTCLVVLPVQAKYSRGSGTAQDPYQIATAADLIALGETPADYGKHFILTADIDLDPNLPGRKVFDKAVIAPDTNPSEGVIGGPAFAGVFNGDGHAISRLTIRGQDSLGLFGYASRAEIKHLGVMAVDIAGSGGNVGAIVGYNSDGDLIHCRSTGVVSGSGECVGGLVGSNYEGDVIHCYSLGTVRSTGFAVGGLVGNNDYGSVTQCYSSCAVSNPGKSGGVGGLVGCIYHATVTDCYSTGAVSGIESVGGLVGLSYEGRVAQCYSSGAVSGSSNVGGIVGSVTQGSVVACFWDTLTSGQTTSAGGTGKTTVQMQDANTYLDAGWDFVDEILNGTCDYWQISPGDYPRLRYYIGDSPMMLEGLGTAEKPYLIRDAWDLGTVWFEPIAHYRLEAAVDLSGITWSAAVVPRFGGTFDGNGYVISNLHIRGGGYLGLFGKLYSGANVVNLGLEVVDVNGTGDCVGGLAGWNYEGNITASYSTGMVTGKSSVGTLVGKNEGTVTQCYSAGAAIGNEDVGGLVGRNKYGGDVTRCHSTGMVTGKWSVGGLVGYNVYGSIAASYSSATASGDSCVGGLIGLTCGSATQCYSNGAVSGREDVGGLVGYDNGQGFRSVGGSTARVTASFSFWDTQTSGQATSAGGTGKTTAQMQTAPTFLAAGWDFVGETANGTADLWWILEGKDYPHLSWELTEKVEPNP